MDDSKVVVLKRFGTSGEAVIYKSLLEANGIKSELLNDTMSGILPIQNETFEVQLIVNESDAEKAKEILAADFDREEFDTESVKRHKKP